MLLYTANILIYREDCLWTKDQASTALFFQQKWTNIDEVLGPAPAAAKPKAFKKGE